MFHASSHVTPTPSPGPGRACAVVIALVAQEKRIPRQLLTHPGRGRAPTAHARQLAMYLAHTALGKSLKEVGEVFGRDRTTVSYACAQIEDMRDDPRFDAEVATLESRIENMMGGTHA